MGAADVDTIEQDAALLRVVEAQQQLEHRRLAGAAGADQRHRLARPDIELEAFQRRHLGRDG